MSLRDTDEANGNQTTYYSNTANSQPSICVQKCTESKS